MNREEWINRLKEVQPMLFEGLRRMVAIPSIRGKEEPDAPFGRGPKQALEEVLKISTELGFHTKNIDDKLGMPNMEKIVQMALIMEFLVMWMSCLLGKDGILHPLV